MKQLLLNTITIILLVLIPYSNCCGQKFIIPNPDSIEVPASQLIKAAKTIQDQEAKIQQLDTLISSFKNNDRLQKSIMLQQSQEIELLNHRIVISDGLIEKYQSYVTDENDKWYEHPLVYFAGGLMTAYVSSLIYNNIK